MKKPWRLIIVLAAAVMFLYTVAAFAYERNDYDFELNTECGYDEIVKGGRYLPVKFEIKENNQHEFSGYVGIVSMESDYSIYRYDYPVNIHAGESFLKKVDIPLGNRANKIFFVIEDENKNEIYRKKVKLNVNQDTAQLVIGVLSDTPEKLQYFDNKEIDYSRLQTKTVMFTTDTFPEETIGLDMVDVILISNFRIRDLSERQSQVLMEWVHNGGVMILGTGKRVDDTLGRYAPELLDESYGDPEVETVDLGQIFELDMVNDILNIPCVSVVLHGGNILFANEHFSAVTEVTKKRGEIAVAAFDFTDLSEAAEKNPSIVDKLLTEVLGEEKINKIAEVLYSGDSDSYWSAKSMLQLGNMERYPYIPIYCIEMLLYIVIAGPGMYIFLKHRNLGKYYRMSLVFTAIIFTLLIYIMGNRTRIKDKFYTYVTFLDTSEESTSETTFVNIRNPYKYPYESFLNNTYSVQPITRNYYSEQNTVPTFTGEEEYKVAIDYNENETILRTQNTNSFEPLYYKLEKINDNNEKYGFYGEIGLFEGKVSGEITNNFPYAVENAAIVFGGQLALIGDLEQGERKTLNDVELINYPLGENYVTSELITGGSQYLNEKTPEYLEILGKNNALSYYFASYLGNYSTEAKVIGFAKQAQPVFLQEQSADTKGIQIVSSSLNVDFYKENKVYRSAFMKNPTVISGQYDLAGNFLYGVDPVVLEYSFGTDIEIDEIHFENISDVFTQNTKYNIKLFSGTTYFYNYTTGNYDSVDISQKKFVERELKNYLSPGNTMKVKYVCDSRNEYNWNIMLPLLMVIGREN